MLIQRVSLRAKADTSIGVDSALRTSAETFSTRSATTETLFERRASSSMSFLALYDNPVVVTVLPCVVALVVIAIAQRKPPFARAYGSVFGVAIAADAFLNGPWTPIKSGTFVAAAVGVVFVIIGDLRYFVVLEHAGANALKLPRAVAWSLLVPAIVQMMRSVLPRLARDERSTYLAYELLFFALVSGIRVFRVPRSLRPTLAKRATALELFQYGTWIVADIGLTLTHVDAFNGVRLVANLIYYVAFVPVMMRLLENEEVAR